MTTLAKPSLPDDEHRTLIAEWEAYCRLCTEVPYHSPEHLAMAQRVCVAAGRYVMALKEGRVASVANPYSFQRP